MKSKYGDISQDDVEKFYLEVSRNVRRIREERNISQLDLALKIGIRSVAFYSNCENLRYDKHFNFEHIYRISKTLGVNMCDLSGDFHVQG